MVSSQPSDCAHNASNDGFTGPSTHLRLVSWNFRRDREQESGPQSLRRLTNVLSLQMENPADDPREFSAHHPEDDAGPGGSPDEMLSAHRTVTIFMVNVHSTKYAVSLQTLLSRGFAERRRQQPNSSGVCHLPPSCARGTN